MTVYLLQAGGSQFIGMYGAPALGYPEATLPASMPLIAFPAGTDGAVAVPITIVDGDPPGVAVPEPPTLLLMFVALTVCAACWKREGLGKEGAQ